MKKQLIISAGISAILALTITAPSAYATTINDDYWGDIIGNKAWFDTQSLDVALTGNLLSVTISTNFASRGDDDLFDGSNQAHLTKGLGIGYGYLFLSNSWNPKGDAPYANDNYSSGTVWSYAFHWMIDGSTAAMAHHTALLVMIAIHYTGA